MSRRERTRNGAARLNRSTSPYERADRRTAGVVRRLFDGYEAARFVERTPDSVAISSKRAKPSRRAASSHVLTMRRRRASSGGSSRRSPQALAQEALMRCIAEGAFEAQLWRRIRPQVVCHADRGSVTRDALGPATARFRAGAWLARSPAGGTGPGGTGRGRACAPAP